MVEAVTEGVAEMMDGVVEEEEEEEVTRARWRLAQEIGIAPREF